MSSTPASFSLHLVRPEKISVQSAEVASSYVISSVSPLVINNDDVVTVSFQSSSPSEQDWIAAYSPPDVNISTTAPVKYGYCNGATGSTYTTTGVGQLTFNMTNLRAGIQFYYFTGPLDSPKLVNASSQIVNFYNINQPLRNRIVATGDQNVYQLLWSSANSTTPLLMWGTQSGVYSYKVYADTSAINKSSLCGSPANGIGWRDLGQVHNASFRGILDLKLSSQWIYYRFGDEATADYSNETRFLVPPAPGQQPPTRPTQVVLLADLGVGSTDNTQDTNVWEEACPPAINTTMSITQMVLDGQVDAIFHSGDVSYANGYMSSWDFFLDMISPMAGRAVYLTTVGNHESDWPNSASLDYGSSSGGECGVLATSLLPMPAPAVTNQPWWSYDIGLIHFVGMSTEHNYSIGSAQYEWLEKDLASTNRTLTPWIVFSGHRSMYVDSDLCCYGSSTCTVCAAGSDVGVMQQLQASVEPLLRTYQVNLAFAGHFHDMQRQSAVYQNQVVQASTLIYDSDGNPVAFHNNPKATVWMVIGSAGNGPNYASENYSWSEKYWDNRFGYAMVTAVNATYLYWQLIDSAGNQILDRMAITQDLSTSWATNATSSDDDEQTGLSTTAEVAIIACSILATVFVLALLLKFVVVPRIANLLSTHPSRATEGLTVQLRERNKVNEV